jgi:DNA-binding response OmpR family regulator
VTKPTIEIIPIAELTTRGIIPDAGPLLPIAFVVDDEHLIADTLVVILRRSGFSAFAFYDAASALEFAATVTPDIVISDVQMSGMNGVDLAIALRKSAPEVKMLLFSGQASTADLLSKAHDNGYTFSVLAKPIYPTDLLAQVSSLMGED